MRRSRDRGVRDHHIMIDHIGEDGASYDGLVLAQLRSRIVALIDRQREQGWPLFHPEAICHRCGGVNVPSWWVDSDRFNVAMGVPVGHRWNGIICPGCFVVLHEEATGMRCTWTLVPDPTTHFRWPNEGEAFGVAAADSGRNKS